ncbi:hypothetical protein V4C56_12870 [Paraburkholderia azotifigens]|uniref:Uncharacterized protein n=1 Tax=Paraburkholderia azotifigens TaxID=2057004 RepID=A0ABU9R178_9BURK|nr:hypothetical protein [Paraburkholderia azotifigens]
MLTSIIRDRADVAMHRTRGLSVHPATLKGVGEFNAIFFLNPAFAVRNPDVQCKSVRIPDAFTRLLQSTIS